MFELDQDIAQEIVDRAMAILPCNVNVMDSQGLILGSGEHDRVNMRHEGAQLVLNNNRSVEIDAAAAVTLRGVQCGVNLPLCLDGRVIGVIGVSGDPSAVRTYAELVKMTAEMLVEQRFDQQHRKWLAERNSSLVQSILFDARLVGRTLVEAQRVGLKPEVCRTPVLLEFSNSVTLSEVSVWLLRHYQDSWCIEFQDHALICCAPLSTDMLSIKLPGELRSQGWGPERVVFGPSKINASRLRQSVQQMIDLASFARAKLPNQVELDLHTLRIPASLWRYREDDGIADLLSPFARLVQADTNGQLRKTLRVWFENACDGQACSEALHIHRNSLRNRLDRIASCSGLDPGKPDGMLTLYLGLMLAPD